MRLEQVGASRKRPENEELAGDDKPKKQTCTDRKDKLPAIDEDDDDDSSLVIEEEMVNEVMKNLEQEITCPCFRLPSLKLNQSKNEESCGPSFSDSSSSVMASIDMCGGSLNVSYYFGVTDERELSSLSLVSPVTDSGNGMEGKVIGDGGFEREDEPWLLEEDDFWGLGLEGIMGGNDLADGGDGDGNGGDGDGDKEWLARVLNEACFEFEE